MLKTAITEEGTETKVLSKTTYDFVKPTVQVYLPALASLYFGLSQIWGLPAGEQVVGSIALITTFLGVILGVSHNRFNNSTLAHDGRMVLTEDPGGVKNFALELDGDPEDLVNKDSISFKVTKNEMPMPPLP